MLLEAIAEGVRGLVERRATQLDARIWAELGWVQESSSGVRVNADMAMKISTVYACVRLISDTMGQLPLDVRRLKANGTSDKVNLEKVAIVLRARPNDWQTSFEWRQMMTSHVLLRGNAYSRIVAGAAGAVDQLIPLHPDCMKVERRVNGGQLLYTYTNVYGQQELYDQEEIFHLRGLSRDGIKGMDPIAYARDTLGLTSALEQHGAGLFKNGARPSAVIKHPGRLTEAASEKLRQRWERIHGGVENAGKTAILEEGMDVTNLGMNSENAQYIQSREFQISDVARLFRVPLHLIQDTRAGAVGYASVEQLSLSFVKFTLGTWLRVWEEAVKRDLLTDDALFIKFNLNGLLRGDAAARAAFYKQLWDIGVFSENDIRELEDMDPVEGGDQRFVPLNYIPLDLARDKAQAAIDVDKQKAQPPPAPVAPAPMPTNDDQVRSLEQRIGELQHRIVFWHDQAADLTIKVPQLELRAEAAHEDLAAAVIERELLTGQLAEMATTLATSDESKRAVETELASNLVLIQSLGQDKDIANAALSQCRSQLDSCTENMTAARDHCIAIMLDAASRMVAWEVGAVKRSTKKSNFIVAIEEFYTEHEIRFMDAMRCPCEMYESLTGQAIPTGEMVTRHITESKEILLAVAGRATAETLAAEVSAVIDQWPTRSATWTTLGVT